MAYADAVGRISVRKNPISEKKMLQTLINAFKVKDIRRKVWMMLLLLLVFRIGCYIPVPGLDRELFQSNFGDGGNDFLTLMSSITGGALANGTLFALGIGPYINASIIMQLLCVGIPPLERLSKQGEEGQKKISQYTRYLTILLAVIQSIGIIVNFAGDSGSIKTQLFFDQTWLAGLFLTVVYTGGAVLVMWLGERITDYGVGNGQSMIIFVGIIATAGQAIVNKFAEIPSNLDAIWELVAFVLVCVVIFFAIVYVDLSERKVPVQYAKQIKGRKMYGGQSTHIPIKVAMAGVIPIIFAMSIMTFPQTLGALMGKQWNWINSNSWLYIIIYFLLIIFFTYFYTAIQFNPIEIANNMKKNGGFVPGIRPGKPTSDFINRVLTRVTLAGAFFLGIIAVLPIILGKYIGFSISIGGTSLLILVGVALETVRQIESQMLMRHYKGFLE